MKEQSAIDRTVLIGTLGDNPEKIQSLLERFVGYAEDSAKEIKTNIRTQNFAQIAFHAHKLKSSALTVGAMQLGQICQSIEIAARNEDWTALEVPLSEFFNALALVRDSINKQSKSVTPQDHVD